MKEFYDLLPIVYRETGETFFLIHGYQRWIAYPFLKQSILHLEYLKRRGN